MKRWGIPERFSTLTLKTSAPKLTPELLGTDKGRMSIAGVATVMVDEIVVDMIKEVGTRID